MSPPPCPAAPSESAPLDAQFLRDYAETRGFRLGRPTSIQVTPMGDSVLFLRAGRPFEILPLPGLTHMVPDPLVMERQWTLTAGFFRKHLGAPQWAGAQFSRFTSTCRNSTGSLWPAKPK